MEITQSTSRSKIGLYLLLLLVIACLLTIAGLAIAVGVYRNKFYPCRYYEKECNKEKDYYHQQLNLCLNGTLPSTNCPTESTTSITTSVSEIITSTSTTNSAMSTSTGLNTPISLLNSAQYCLSQECAVSAGEILSRMDLSVDPCVDFYKYACGRYARPENRPPGEFVKQTFDLPYEETERQLYYALTTNGSDYRGASSTAIRKAKDYFSACMSNPGDDAKGRALLLQIIRDLKSWPVAADPTPGAPAWNDSSWNIEDALVAAHGLNVNGLVGLTLAPHPSNSSTLVIATQPATLVLEDPLLYKDANKGRDYRDYIVQTLTLIYGTENESNFADWANKIWDFESSVANIYPSKSELAQISNVNNLIKVGNSNSLPYFSWIPLLNKEFENSGVTINADTDLLLGPQQYFQSYADIIANLGPNVTQVLPAYHVWTVVSALAPYAGKSFKLAKDTLKAKLSGASCESEDTWKICLDDTLVAGSFAAGAAYVQQYVNNTDTEKLDQLLGLFKDSLINGTASKQWIQEQSRQTILNRANSISWEIGTPAFLDTAAKLDQYYNNLNVSPNAYFQNVIDQRRFQVSLLRQKYGKPVDGAVWTRKPTDTYSYYNPSTNKVIIQAGLLHQPMYDRNFPLAFIYGGLGSILGQKMMMLYGFNEDWWDSNTRTGFNGKATCFIDQYNALSFHQIPVNGTITAVENIADAEGLRIAYQAYMKAASSSSDPQQFDKFFTDLDLSGPKQFFLGFTQLGCFNVDPARVAEAIVPNHVPSPLRVQTLLQNTPEFAEAFQCTSGSPMKLANPCLL